MKNILRDSLGRFKSLNVNLMDGQRRGEVVFRRLFVLLVGAVLVYLILLAFVGKKENREEVQAVEEAPVFYYCDQFPQECEGEDPLIEDKPVKDPVKDYIKSYGGKISDSYLASLRRYCDEDTLKLVIAISVAETSMGKNTDRGSNFYGYFYGGDRKYDPNQETMSKVICNGIGRYYSDVATNAASAKRYTGGDDTGTWMSNVNIALSKMR